MVTMVNLSDVSEKITVIVIGQETFVARWWIATRLFVIAAMIAGCNIEISTRVSDEA